MVKKGKKLWKSIDTQDIQEVLEEKSRLERQGLAVDKVPDAELFYIDTEQDKSAAAAVAKGLLPRKRKKEPRLLRCQAIISGAHKTKPVNPAANFSRKKRGPATKPSSKNAIVRNTENAKDQSSVELDLWGDKALEIEAQPQKKSRESLIKAVEVDAPGCSFNPDSEQHQDVVAEAVALELNKLHAKEMIPQPPKVFNHLPVMDDLEALLVDVEDDDEEEEDEVDVSEAAGGSAEGIATPRRAPARKTQADRNRGKRRREAEVALEAKKQLKKQRRELDSLKTLQSELATKEAIDKARAVRKAVNKAEKALTQPPRLGKHKFEPANIQVLLSEEVDGSLRRLKGTPTLAKERFKALQKRGMIEPRVRIEPGQLRTRKAYQMGDRAEKAAAGHQETVDQLARTARRKLAAKK